MCGERYSYLFLASDKLSRTTDVPCHTGQDKNKDQRKLAVKKGAS